MERNIEWVWGRVWQSSFQKQQAYSFKRHMKWRFVMWYQHNIVKWIRVS